MVFRPSSVGIALTHVFTTQNTRLRRKKVGGDEGTHNDTSEVVLGSKLESKLDVMESKLLVEIKILQNRRIWWYCPQTLYLHSWAGGGVKAKNRHNVLSTRTEDQEDKKKRKGAGRALCKLEVRLPTGGREVEEKKERKKLVERNCER